LNQLDAALDDCKTAVNLNPNDYKSLYTMGRLLVERKQYDIAIDELTKALQHKADVNAYYWRGVAYLKSDAQKAEADFSQCILLGDESPDTYRDRGWARIALKNKAGARSDWQHALDGYKQAGMTPYADIMAGLLQKIDSL